MAPTLRGNGPVKKFVSLDERANGSHTFILCRVILLFYSAIGPLIE